jgi:hypothetical protein
MLDWSYGPSTPRTLFSNKPTAHHIHAEPRHTSGPTCPQRKSDPHGLCGISEAHRQGDGVRGFKLRTEVKPENAHPDFAIAEAELLRMKRGAFSGYRTRVMMSRRVRVAMAED